MFCPLFPSGVFICRGKEDALVTKNMAVGESVYGEKRMSVEVNPLLNNLSIISNWGRLSILLLFQDTLSSQLLCWSGPESVLVDDLSLLHCDWALQSLLATSMQTTSSRLDGIPSFEVL